MVQRYVASLRGPHAVDLCLHHEPVGKFWDRMRLDGVVQLVLKVALGPRRLAPLVVLSENGPRVRAAEAMRANEPCKRTSRGEGLRVTTVAANGGVDALDVGPSSAVDVRAGGLRDVHHVRPLDELLIDRVRQHSGRDVSDPFVAAAAAVHRRRDNDLTRARLHVELGADRPVRHAGRVLVLCVLVDPVLANA